jgi:hypothetical protein
LKSSDEDVIHAAVQDDYEYQEDHHPRMAFALSCTLSHRIPAIGAVSAAQSLAFSLWAFFREHQLLRK